MKSGRIITRHLLRVTILQQYKSPQRTPLGIGRRGLAGIIPTRRSVLIGLAHVTELRACKHVRAFRHTRDAILIHIGCRLINPLDCLKLHRTVTVITMTIGVLIERRLAGMRAKLPRPSGKHALRLVGKRGQRPVMLQSHISGNRRQTEPPSQIGNDDHAILNHRQPAGNRCRVKTDIAGCLRMRLGIKTQQPHVIGDNDSVFRSQHAGAMRLCILNPAATRLITARITKIFADNRDHRTVMPDRARRGSNRILQIGHDLVDPGRQRFGLRCLNHGRQRINVGIAPPQRQPPLIHQWPHANH